jgi:hypothetical protein
VRDKSFTFSRNLKCREKSGTDSSESFEGDILVLATSQGRVTPSHPNSTLSSRTSHIFLDTCTVLLSPAFLVPFGASCFVIFARRLNVSTPYVDEYGIRVPPHLYDDEDGRDKERLKALCTALGVIRHGNPGPMLMVDKLNRITLERATIVYEKACCKALYLPYDEANCVMLIRDAIMPPNTRNNSATGDFEMPGSSPGHEGLPDEQGPQLSHHNSNNNDDNNSNIEVKVYKA